MNANQDIAFLTNTCTAGRLSGTPGARLAAGYLAAQLQEAGYSAGGLGEYFDPLQVPAMRLKGPVHLSIAGQRLLHRQDFSEVTRLSKGGAFCTELLVLRDGEQVTPEQLQGKAVLIPKRPLDFDLDATASAAAEYGAAALLVEYGEPGWFYKSVYVGQEYLPVLRLRRSLAAQLCSGDRLELHLPLEQQKRSCQNVVAYLPGCTQGPLLALTAHYDHVGDDADGTRFPGACDNASGVALVLDVARQLAAACPLPFQVMVAFLTGEESGFWGARHLLEQLSDGLAAVINVDSLGSGPLSTLNLGHIRRGDGLAELAANVLAEQGIRAHWTAEHDDSQVFLAAGIPTIGLSQPFNRLERNRMHTPGDTPETLSTTSITAGARAVLAIIERLASQCGSTTFPYFERKLCYV